MEEYRVKLTVRNNLLLSAIENAGYKSQSEFARAAELATTQVNELVAMRKAPIMMSGEFCESAKKIMEVLGALPQELWTEKQLFMELDRNTSNKFIYESNIQELLENNSSAMMLADQFLEVSAKEKKEKMLEILQDLTPMEKRVIKLRFGIGDTEEKTLSEVAKNFSLSKERVRQIEEKALRKLRHPTRAIKLCNLMENSDELEKRTKKAFEDHKWRTQNNHV